MKKIFALICAGIITCSLTACGGEVSDTTDAGVTHTEKTEIETTGDTLLEDTNQEDAKVDKDLNTEDTTDAATDVPIDAETDAKADTDETTAE